LCSEACRQYTSRLRLFNSIPSKRKSSSKRAHKGSQKALSGHVPRPIPSQVHTFRRTYPVAYSVTDTLVHRSVPINLGALPHYSEFTSLFDCYRITHVKMMFLYDQNSSQSVEVAVGVPQVTFIPYLITVNDFDDATPLTALSDYCEYENFKVERMDRPLTISFVPRIASAVYSGGAFTGYSQAPPLAWVDSGSPSVEYYGIKWAVNGNIEGGVGTHQLGTYSIFFTFTIQCKDPR